MEFLKYPKKIALETKLINLNTRNRFNIKIIFFIIFIISFQISIGFSIKLINENNIINKKTDDNIYLMNLVNKDYYEELLGSHCNYDSDDDGISDKDENIYNTDPKDDDTDDDNINDGDEVNVYNTDPTDDDTDDDRLTDGEEILKYFTDPTDDDTDDDRLTDGEEILKYFTDPCLSDTDQDGFSDYEEIIVYHTNPKSSIDNPNTIKIIITIGIYLIFMLGSYVSYLHIKNIKSKNNKRFQKILNEKEILRQKYNHVQEKIKNRCFAENNINILTQIVRESKKYNFPNIYSDTLNKLEFCKDMKKINTSILKNKNLNNTMQQTNYLIKKGDKNYLENFYLIAIDYWKESIDICKFVLEHRPLYSERERLFYKIFDIEDKIIFAYIIHSEKYCNYAKESIECGNFTDTKKKLIVSIDSYQNALAQLKKFKIYFKFKKAIIPMKHFDSKLNNFNLIFIPQGIKIVLFDSEIIIKNYFSLENEDLLSSIQLISESIRKLKKYLNYLDLSLYYKLLNYN